MKKILAFSIISFLCFTPCHAQDTNSCLSLSIGAGFPLANYGSKNPYDYQNGTVGYADAGFNSSLILRFKTFNARFGTFLLASYNINKFDINGFLNPGQFYSKPPYYTESLLDLTESAGYYQEYSFLPGFFLSYKIKRISIDLRFSLGFSYFQFPSIQYNYDLEVSYNGITNNSNYNADFEGNGGFAFAQNVGTTIKYSFKNRLYYLLNIDFLHSVTDFTYTENFSPPTQGPSGRWISEDTEEQSSHVFLLNLNLGIGLKL